MANSRLCRQTLTVEHWSDAALDALAEGGVDAVAVEPIARRLGVTKGSFYWHFPNRQALLDAALQRWERQQTEEVIARAEQEQDAMARISRLFRSADASRRAGRIYLSLALAGNDPVVGAVVRRVTQRRIRFITDCYRALGLDPDTARRRAMVAYSVYLGTLQLRRDAPELIPAGPDFQDYMDNICCLLIPGFASSNAVGTGRNGAG
jgi:AcrR family transcriptional regulator